MRKGERKRQLLAHARALLTADGLSAVTPERVAVAAGVTPGVVGRYFDGPPALLRAVLADVLPKLLPVPESAAEGEAGDDPQGRLQRLLEAYFAAARGEPEGLRVVLRALVEAADDETRTQLRDGFQAAAAPLAELIRGGQQAGVFRRSLDADAAAGELLRALLGYALVAPLDLPPPAADNPAQPVEYLLHGLLKTDV